MVSQQTDRLIAMAIFSRSPAKQLDAATAARDKLAERLRDAEIAVADLLKEAERLALLGAADDQLDTAEARTRAMVDRVTTLSSALTQSKATVADLERRRDEAADRKTREATSVEIEGLVRAISSDCSRLIAIAASLAGHTAQAAAIVPEAGGVLNLCQIIACQIPEANTLIGKLLRVHSQAVLDGRAAAAMPVRAAVEQQIFQLDHPPPAVPPEPERLAEPIMSTAFTPFDRGPPVVLKIATTRS
jgi:hypothetical protein